MSQGESYPIKTSPVNPAGWLAEPGKCITFCTWPKQAYLNCIKFKVSDETCNSSWVLSLISKIEDKNISIIKNHLPNYLHILKFVFHLPLLFGVLKYQRFIDTHLEVIWKKKSMPLARLGPIVPFCWWGRSLRHRVTNLDCKYCFFKGNSSLPTLHYLYSETFEKIYSFLKVSADCLFYSSDIIMVLLPPFIFLQV